MTMNKLVIFFLILSVLCTPVLAIDMGPIQPINPIEFSLYQPNVISRNNNIKKSTLTKNSVVNQYNIAFDKYRQSNVKASYQDFKMIITNTAPNDYVYMKLSKEMATMGFYSLAELSVSKINDKELSTLLDEDLKIYFYPVSKLSYQDQIYLAELYSNMMYNDQCREATNELLKHNTLLENSDYANYLVAYGSMKSADIKQAEKFINIAINKNPKCINYKRLKAEIYAQSEKPQLGVKYLNDIDKNSLRTVVFDKELHSSEQYVLYKAAKNEYYKKYHLAYYYYDEGELNRALRVLQTAISGKKNINKDVFRLTSQVYYEMQEFEKAQDYALKTLTISPKDNKALIILGDISTRNKDYKQAESYYKKAEAWDDSNLSTIKLAETFELQGNIKKAKELYSKVLKVSSKAYQAYYHIALLEKDREKSYIKKALSINFDFKDAWIDLARIDIENNDYDSATSCLNVAKYLDDNDYRYYYFYGLILKNKGLIAEAQKSFEKSYSLNSDYQLVKKELNI